MDKFGMWFIPGFCVFAVLGMFAALVWQLMHGSAEYHNQCIGAGGTVAVRTYPDGVVCIKVETVNMRGVK